MTANDSKSYLIYLNKFLDQYNNNYHHSIGETLLVLMILLWLKKLRPILKLLKLMIESELIIIRIFLVKATLKISQKKFLLLILFWSLILGLIKLKI